MPLIKYKKALERVLRKPVFTPQDLHNERIPKNYSKKLLHLLAKQGRIRRIERGKYTCLDDPVAVAAHMTKPCYLSLWTAMSIRNLTTQVPFAVEVVTSRKRFARKVDFLGTVIKFHAVDPKMMFGYENIIWKENFRIPVANKEKIIIDAVHIGHIPEEEIFDMIKISNAPLLKRYANLTGNEKIKNKIKEMIKCSQQKR
ncbi:MAG TPA: hypothetical protein HA230_01780 [Candidatus Aenigmarchaeota archaeon]|nr:hypothetical protein [Candidatus Aenigmarchaeota archaeon]